MIKDVDPINGKITVDGMHIRSYEIAELKLSLERITDAMVIDGTYAPVNNRLVNDIQNNPEKYLSVFSDTVNLKILNYLSRCSKLDQTPYKTNVVIIDNVDDEILGKNTLKLNDKQFDQIVRGFQKKANDNKNYKLQTTQLGLNLLSINYSKGIYVLAYQPLRLDIKNRTLKAVEDIAKKRGKKVSDIL